MENIKDIIDFSFNNDEEFTFDKIIISREKIEQYALNNYHSTGKNKAIIFNQKLGIKKENLTICSAWIIDQEKYIMLTTAYVLEKNKQKNKKLNEIYYIDPKEKYYYSKIFNLAEQEAKI